jgi:hypothetical protein
MRGILSFRFIHKKRVYRSSFPVGVIVIRAFERNLFGSRSAMPVLLLLLLMATILQSRCAASEAASIGADVENAAAIEHLQGLSDIRFVLSASLESRREEFRQNYIHAQIRLRNFARQYGWEKLTETPFVTQIEIYDTKDGFDKRMRSFSPDETNAKIPKTFSACIEKGIFAAVSPEIYVENYADGREPDAYEKLMTHELAHRLHVRICKDDEDKMGPVWFYEGFAIYVADQLNLNRPKLSTAEIWSILDASERGSYAKYNVVFRYFLKDAPLPEYVQRAGEPGFREWLKAHCGPS